LPGSGKEFLDFHHQFIIDFHIWYDAQSFADQSVVAAWSSIPAQVKAGAWGPTDINNFETQANNPSAFATEDDLGRFIEPVHNQGHGIIATVFNDPLMGPIHTSVMSTFCYQWHGIIDLWRNKWLNAHKSRIAEVPSAGISAAKALADTAPKSLIFEVPPKTLKEALDTVAPKAIKDAADVIPVPGLGPGPDPTALLQQLARRVTEIEVGLATGRSFIHSAERPDTGGGGSHTGSDAPRDRKT